MIGTKSLKLSKNEQHWTGFSAIRAKLFIFMHITRLNVAQCGSI